MTSTSMPPTSNQWFPFRADASFKTLVSWFPFGWAAYEVPFNAVCTALRVRGDAEKISTSLRRSLARTSVTPGSDRNFFSMSSSQLRHVMRSEEHTCRCEPPDAVFVFIGRRENDGKSKAPARHFTLARLP